MSGCMYEGINEILSKQILHCSFDLNGTIDESGKIEIKSVEITPAHDCDRNEVDYEIPMLSDDDTIFPNVANPLITKPCHHIVGRKPEIHFRGAWYYTCMQCDKLLPANAVDDALHRTPNDWLYPEEWQAVYDAMRVRGLSADVLWPMPRRKKYTLMHSDGKPLDKYESYLFGYYLCN